MESLYAAAPVEQEGAGAAASAGLDDSGSVTSGGSIEYSRTQRTETEEVIETEVSTCNQTEYICCIHICVHIYYIHTFIHTTYIIYIHTTITKGCAVFQVLLVCSSVELRFCPINFVIFVFCCDMFGVVCIHTHT